MIQRVVKPIPLFESLGLFTEAPKKKKPAEVISVRPIKQDYADYINDEEIDIDDDPDDLSDYNDYIDDEGDVDLGADPEADGELGGEVEVPPPAEETPEEVSEQQPETEPTEGEGEVIDATGEDPEADGNLGGDVNEEPVDSGETPTPEAPPEDSNNGGDGGEVIDATADSDDPGADPEADGNLGGDVSMDAPPDDGAPPDPNMQDGQDGAQSYTKDDMRKFELFNRTLEMYNSVLYIIDKNSVTVTDNPKFGYAMKQALMKLKAIKTLMKDYMLLKFQSDSYLQNSFFYEKVKAYVMLLLELMEINKKTEDQK